MNTSNKFIYLIIKCLVWHFITILAEAYVMYDSCLTASGRLEFNPALQICCNGHVVPRFNENFKEIGCCGNITYSVDKEICCGGRTLKKISPSGQRRNCCGKHIYQSNSMTLCCGMTEPKLYLDAGLDEGCCGSQKYDYRQFVCCSDYFGNTTLSSKFENHQCCGSLYYNHVTHDCVNENKIMIKGQRICGETEYNVEDKICCMDKLYDSKGDQRLSCCGDRSYDTTTHQCCYNTEEPHVIPVGRICCGSGFYDPATQRCCMDKVVNSTGREFRCCGSHLYNPGTESCCMPGGKVYNAKQNRCCKGSLVDTDRECCGTVSYNPAQQVCCNKEFPINKTHISQNRCCYSRTRDQSIPYDDSKQRCIMRNNKSYIEKRVPKCGWKTFNKTTDLCCNMELIAGGRDKGWKCCPPGRLAYNPRNQICCNSVVYDKTERKRCSGYKENNPCDICINGNHNLVKHKLKQISDICQRHVILLKLKWHKKIRNGIKLKGNIKSILHGSTRRHSVVLTLPCRCSLKTKQIYLLTTDSIKKKNIYLNQSDVLISASKHNSKHLKSLLKRRC